MKAVKFYFADGALYTQTKDAGVAMYLNALGEFDYKVGGVKYHAKSLQGREVLARTFKIRIPCPIRF